MKNVKAGDWVVCNYKNYQNLTYNQLYVVLGIRNGWLKVRNDNGEEQYFTIHVFRPSIHPYEEEYNKFKVGDIVRCIDADRCDLLDDVVYVITDIDNENIWVDGGDGWYNYEKFELCEEKGEKEIQSFKVGDEVRALYAGDYDLSVHVVYKVVDVAKDCIKVDGSDYWMNYKRFELYVKKGENKMERQVESKIRLYKDIKNVYFNEKKRTTVIVFENGDISKATAAKGTKYCEHAGLITALFKYEYGFKVEEVEKLIQRKRGK